MTKDELEALARGLRQAQRDFLRRVCTKQDLRLADREEDRVRQSLRRLGLVHVVKNPRRWEPTTRGKVVHALIERTAHEQ